jgi:quercetin dioxygenase-like cupin family protein
MTLNKNTRSALIRSVSLAGALMTAAACTTSTAALAGSCPADQVAANAMQAPPEGMMPKDVTDNVIATIDLKAYGREGYLLRTRRLVIQPGGVVPWHSHQERPANIYIVEGAVTEYQSTCAVPIDHVAGDVTAEHGDLSHWWKNNGDTPAVLISTDIVPAPMENEPGM